MPSLPNKKEKKDKKEKKFKTKVFVATWSGSGDSSDESESEEDRVNICFIVEDDLEDEVNDPNSYPLIELQETFDLLLD